MFQAEHFSFRLSFLVLAIGAVLARAQTCFFPDGSEAPGRTACNGTATHSHCCSVNDLCLSDGFCWGYGESWANRVIRDACTDSSWNDPSCPQHCQAFDNYAGTVARTILMVDDSAQGKFCCVGSVKNASANTGYKNATNRCGYVDMPADTFQPFAIGEGLAIVNRTSGSTGANTTVTAVVTTIATPYVYSSSKTSAAAVGAGVGVLLGVLWLVTQGLLVWKWRQAARWRAEAATARPISEQWVDEKGGAFGKYQPTELGGGAPPPELPVLEPMSELDGVDRRDVGGGLAKVPT